MTDFCVEFRKGCLWTTQLFLNFMDNYHLINAWAQNDGMNDYINWMNKRTIGFSIIFYVNCFSLFLWTVFEAEWFVTICGRGWLRDAVECLEGQLGFRSGSLPRDIGLCQGLHKKAAYQRTTVKDYFQIFCLCVAVLLAHNYSGSFESLSNSCYTLLSL